MALAVKIKYCPESDEMKAKSEELKSSLEGTHADKIEVTVEPAEEKSEKVEVFIGDSDEPAITKDQGSLNELTDNVQEVNDAITAKLG